ncbi:MAG: hypothetical protein JNN06_02025 [Gemmobacter sp.]|uniref:hypothetical protein n=1 Tax=Gemmobacter sp. TaxID=1898957 RepID=UPI001A61406A|nr:hypothetical protein [Gemmobacter sp.]MBL8561034.1 hypothetical protein [Gemmobacter sp.]
MDYNKSGQASTGKKAPKRHQEHNQRGGKANPFGSGEAPAKEDKAALLARMKALAAAKKQG